MMYNMLQEKKRSFLWFRRIVFVVAFFMVIGGAPVYGAVDTQPGTKPDVAANLYQVGTGDYEESTNSYDDGNVEYWLLTQDANKAGDTTIDYMGVTYNLAGVKVVTPTDSLLDNNLWKADTTVFVDPGTYNDNCGYYDWSKVNLSVVGTDTNDKPVFKRVMAGNTGGWLGYDYCERHGFAQENIYIRDIVFDGNNLALQFNSRGRDLVTIACGKTGTGADNGTGANNFLMKDCVIQNVGSTGLFGFNQGASGALQVLYGDAKVNLEGLTIQNIKAGNSHGYVMHTNAASNVFIRDLTLDDSQGDALTKGLKIENTHHTTLPYAVPIADMGVVMDGTNVITSGYVQIEDYTYDKVNVPMDYPYVEYYNTNSDENQGTYRVWQDYSMMTQSNQDHPRLDRNDNYWIVDENLTRSVSDQIADIHATREYMKTVVNEDNVALNSDRIPPFNVKLVAKDGDIDSFDIPAAVTDEVTIVAVSAVTDNANTAGTMIPTVADFKAEFTNTGNTELYNFDFKALSKYTYHEVNDPVDTFFITDPYDGNYPVGMNAVDYSPATLPQDPMITKAGTVGYNNCLFVGLVSELNATFDAPVVGGDYEMTEGDTAQVSTDIQADETYNAPTNMLTKDADDKDLYYESSDGGVAWVNPNGEVIGVSPGTAIIYVKAIDTFNGGEIEKPYASFELIVKEKLYKATHTFASDDGSPLPQSVMDLLPADQVGLSDGTPVFPQQPAMTAVDVGDGIWTFQGYNPLSETINGADVNFEGIWNFEEKAVLTTSWVDTEGNTLKDSVEGFEVMPHGEIDGYTYVETRTDDDGNATHVFKKNKEQKPGAVKKVNSDGSAKTGDQGVPWYGLLLLALSSLGLALVLAGRKIRKS